MNNPIFYNQDLISGVREFDLLAFIRRKAISSIAGIEIIPCKSGLPVYTFISDNFSDLRYMG